MLCGPLLSVCVCTAGGCGPGLSCLPRWGTSGAVWEGVVGRWRVSRGLESPFWAFKPIAAEENKEACTKPAFDLIIILYQHLGGQWGVWNGHVGLFTICFAFGLQRRILPIMYGRELLLNCPHNLLWGLLVWGGGAPPAPYVMQVLWMLHIQRLHSTWSVP